MKSLTGTELERYPWLAVLWERNPGALIILGSEPVTRVGAPPTGLLIERPEVLGTTYAEVMDTLRQIGRSGTTIHIAHPDDANDDGGDDEQEGEGDDDDDDDDVARRG